MQAKHVIYHRAVPSPLWGDILINEKVQQRGTFTENKAAQDDERAREFRVFFVVGHLCHSFCFAFVTNHKRIPW